MTYFDDHPLTSNQFVYHETANVSDKRKGPTVRPTPQSFNGVQKTRYVRCSKPAYISEPK